MKPEQRIKLNVMTEARNVLGQQLEICCTSPMTGYYRDGKCNTGEVILAHTLCVLKSQKSFWHSLSLEVTI